MNNNNNQYNKLPRSIVIANNKKKADIKNILTLRDEMNKNNIDSKLINQFVNEQYDKINKEYEERLKKYNDKKIKNNDNKINNEINNEIKKKRGKAVEFLLKNKTFLEEHGASKDYVKKYVDKQYQEINEYYTNKNELDDIDIESINFID